MMRLMILAAAVGSCALSVPALAQVTPAPINGTRLDIVATGEVTRVPDLATINAGVVTMAPTASAAIAQNGRQMESVRAALKKAGIADRDIQTSTIALNPQYRYQENESPVLTGYQATNQVSVRFRDIARSGPILDALVGQGANQINGPSLGIDKPATALDEARMAALATARARAETYARQLGRSVGRILSISESGEGAQVPMPVMMQAMRDSAATKIDPGQQTLSVTLAVSFELN